jgi:hypothetical protein
MEEPEPFLDKTAASGKALYEAGLPEWLDWIDQYKHDDFRGVAIIQNPSESDLDSKGYYKNDWRLLDNYLFQPAEDDLWKSIGLSPQALFTMRLKDARFEISSFLFYRSIMKILSEMTAIHFHDDVDHWYHSLESAVKFHEASFNTALRVSPRAQETFAGMPHNIDLEGLQPSPDLENLIRNRLAQPLKKRHWLQDCKRYFLRERLSGLPREEVEEMFSGVGNDARKRIYRILEPNNRSDAGISGASG